MKKGKLSGGTINMKGNWNIFKSDDRALKETGKCRNVAAERRQENIPMWLQKGDWKTSCGCRNKQDQLCTKITSKQSELQSLLPKIMNFCSNPTLEFELYCRPTQVAGSLKQFYHTPQEDNPGEFRHPTLVWH